MKKRVFISITIIVSFFLFQFVSFAQSTSIFGSNASSREKEKPERRDVQYKGFLLLEEVLKDISAETGISFILANSLSNEKVYVPAKSNNWESTVKRLLKDYSTLQVWSDDLDESRIWIFERELNASNTSPPTETVKTSLPDRAKNLIKKTWKRTRSFYNPGIQETKKTGEDSFYIFPPHIRHDPEVLRFLYSKSFYLPEEIREKYGEYMEHLPPERPMYPHVRNHPVYRKFLKDNDL